MSSNMTDSGHYFYSDDHKKNVLNVREKYKHLLEELKSIPHLKISIEFDLQKVQEEVFGIKEWVPNILEEEQYEGTQYVNYHAKKNHGRALFEYIPDSYFMKDTNSNNRDLTDAHYDDEGRLKYFETDLVQKMPKTFELLYRLMDRPRRTRIMITPGTNSTDWHMHHREAVIGEPYYWGLYYIPIFTNHLECHHGVRSANREYEEEFYHRYYDGEVGLFNTYHQHTVESVGLKDRVNILATFDLDYEPNLIKLKPIVDSYIGPRIKI